MLPLVAVAAFIFRNDLLFISESRTVRSSASGKTDRQNADDLKNEINRMRMQIEAVCQFNLSGFYYSSETKTRNVCKTFSCGTHASWCYFFLEW